MNILFVYSLNTGRSLPKPLETQDEMQFGISYISSFLKKHGHNTDLIVLTRKSEDSAIDTSVEKFRPGMICFTAVTTEYMFIENIARRIKEKYPRIFLMIGGVHVSLNPEEAMLDTFDALCIGEGEAAALELVDRLERNSGLSGIGNLWIKNGSKIEKSQLKPFLQDIDGLPFPDREMWQAWVSTTVSRQAILLGRGCPYKCTYCCNHALSKLTTGSYVRFRSPDNILAEINGILEKFPKTKDIYMEVETITSAKDGWISELCSRIEELNSKRPEPITFGVNMRISKHSDKLEGIFIALGKANFRHINIGLESGSERVRKDILKRDYSNQDVIDTVRLARRHGLLVWFYNLTGIPGETRKDFMETVRVNRICAPDFYYLYIFYPYPGTDLHSICKESGLLKKVSRNTHVERVKAVLDTREFRKEEIQRNFIWFDYYVNKDRMTDETLFGAVLNMYLMVYEGRSKISIMGMVLRDIVIDAIHYGGKISVLPAIAGRTTRGLLKRLRRIV